MGGLREATEVGSCIAPQFLRIQVDRAVNVHERLCLAREKNDPMRAFLLDTQLLRELAAQGPQLVYVKSELSTSPNLCELVNALPEDPSVWSELVPVQAGDRDSKLRNSQGCYLGLLRLPGRNMLLLLQELQLLKLLDLLKLLKLLRLLKLLQLMQLHWHHNLRCHVCCHWKLSECLGHHANCHVLHVLGCCYERHGSGSCRPHAK
mmetsp:Transcript_114646/g.364371  ORF Transcript_114646/g.364371 Transcript_114646/m.364371 type:complete len:206 (-) Transcript_114646:70-687(-)